MSLLKKIAENKKVTKPVIYGVEGVVLNDIEKNFFAKNGCLGFIVFARNIVDKIQLKKLTDSMREVMEGEVLILIDQEGGRVARMKEPNWKKYPAAKYFADLYQTNQSQAKEELFKNFVEIASDLAEVGINVDCAPVLDILSEKTHQVIGDRAYGNNAKQVAELGKVVCQALLSKNIYPVIKHIPGHGQGSCDSHLELPIVDCSFDQLKENDFLPFQELANQKFAMTAHILYSEIDQKNCATTSKKAIDLIRNEIGFKNILMSDDVSMKALKGSFFEKSQAILNAGCDIVLHCNGNMAEMIEINSALPNLTDKFFEKFVK